MNALRKQAVEAIADAVWTIDADTIEVRDWGEEAKPDGTRLLAEAALDGLVAYLREHREAECRRIRPEHECFCDNTGALLDVLEGEPE